MRGHSHPESIKEKCKTLRYKGYSLNELTKLLDLPKTTVQNWVNQIQLSEKAKARIKGKIKIGIIKAHKNRKYYKRIVHKPKNWSTELILIISHFLFDGEILSHGCSYSSRNKAQIKIMSDLIEKTFKIKPKILIKKDNVTRINYYYTDLAEYIKKKSKLLINYIKKAPKEEKRALLRAFFDDEGNVTFNKDVRKVRGFQHSKKILLLIKKLLKAFNIKSNIDKRNTEITITKKDNLIKFQKEINFSSRIFINPKRKNSLWKNKIEKREILKKAINSYQI